MDLSFVNKVASLSILDILVALAVSFALGLFIFFVYKRTFSGVMYSQSFAISLIAMNLITCLVIVAVSTNLIAALGMVGALSIVRFRTVIKEPLDLVYLFWSIAIGIIIGVGLIPLAVIGSIAIGGILSVFVHKKDGDTPYVVVVNCNDEKAEVESLELIKSRTKKQVMKSKSVSRNGIELTVEVRLSGETVSFLNELLGKPGVSNAVLVSYNGNYYM
ncbi:MAG: DUF4956 domain-containing protein [Planctomycetaceae bacterium]|nr:DUF4956 domain-containing protein [Planctomycetaceae bacterium]